MKRVFYPDNLVLAPKFEYGFQLRPNIITLSLDATAPGCPFQTEPRRRFVKARLLAFALNGLHLLSPARALIIRIFQS